MATLLQLTRFLNRELRVNEIPDFSRNGLQVNGGQEEIKKVGLAVDACFDSFDAAKKTGCQLLICHHGIIWKRLRESFGIRKRYISYLKRKRLSLYGVHLPLDCHPELGNNAQLAKLLQLKGLRPFGKYHGSTIGFKGRFNKPISARKLGNLLDKKLRTKCIVLDDGRKGIKTIGIVSGGGASAFMESVGSVDCLLVGEAPHHIATWSKDLRQNVIIAGHYHTETLGVKAVGRLLEQKFKIKTVFLDIPTKI